MEIRIPFIAETRQTLQERKDGVRPEAVDKVASSLKDRDNRNKGVSQQADNGHYDYGNQDF